MYKKRHIRFTGTIVTSVALIVSPLTIGAETNSTPEAIISAESGTHFQVEEMIQESVPVEVSNPETDTSPQLEGFGEAETSGEEAMNLNANVDSNSNEEDTPEAEVNANENTEPDADDPEQNETPTNPESPTDEPDMLEVDSDEYESGYDEGYSDGYEDGFDTGYYYGYEDGFDEGYMEGYNDGLYDDDYGWYDGIDYDYYGVNTLNMTNQISTISSDKQTVTHVANQKSTDDNKLPNTATSAVDWLVGGFIMMLAGLTGL